MGGGFVWRFEVDEVVDNDVYDIIVSGKLFFFDHRFKRSLFHLLTSP